MKRKLLIPAMLLLLGATGATGQNVLEKGTTYVDAYYGFPNLITSALRSANNNSGSTNVTVKGIGPLGGRVMYMLGEKIGLGLDFNYANSSVSWNKIDSSNGKIYYYKASLPRFRIMGSFEYHIRQTSNFDFYYMLRMGYGQWSPTFETNDPNASPGKVNWSVPFAFRTGLGARYYFTKYFGANIDIGFFGGGAVQAGLSTKF